MDPSKATDVVSFSQMINLRDGLYRNSKDGLIYTFNLRKSKWNDGTPVTARNCPGLCLLLAADRQSQD